MKRDSIQSHFKKIYPDCTLKQITDLIEAIKGEKYWNLSSEHKEIIYVIALTRARTPFLDGFKAKVTHLKEIIVHPEAAKYSRKGRIIVAVKDGTGYYGRSIITWSAFLKLINENPNIIYNLYLEKNIPFYINNKILSKLLIKKNDFQSKEF